MADTLRPVVHPLPMERARAIVTRWFADPHVVRLEPGDQHWEILSGVLERSRAGSPLITDAHLAALATEHGAQVVSTDRDFVRFEGIRVLDPTRPA